MKLRTNNRNFSVSHSGRDFLILKEPASFPAGAAVFSVTIDGETTEYPSQVEALADDIRVVSSRSEPSAQMVAEP
ncbi:MAG: hypothetical protein P1U86_16460 [Verrucomicrobiales bacterium]|nr:hypothetical protein [Verrucomicrobiales bacterium]